MSEEKKPLYIKIVEEYREKILQGELKAGDRLPSESDISTAYNVSRITSKRAFEELEREGFIYRIKGSGSYVADRRKYGVSRDSINNIKIIDFILPFDSSCGRSIDLIRGVNDILQKNGYLLNIQNTNLDPGKEKEILLNLHNADVSGIIFYPFTGIYNNDILQMLTLNKNPIVTIDKYFDGLQIGSVVSDNFTGSYNAISYLIKKGHKNIGYISDTGIESATTVRDRFYGYCKALSDNGLILSNNNFIFPQFNKHFLTDPGTSTKKKDYFKKIINFIMDRNDRLTAIHTDNDYVAIDILRAASNLGIRVPDDLSLIGFDNIEISQYLEVPLTTVEQDFYKIGYQAAMILVERISDNRVLNDRIVIPTRLIERESVLDIQNGTKEILVKK